MSRHPMNDALHLGDCLDVMCDKIPDNSIDLIVTSPPYAGVERKYGVIPHDQYVDWFLERAVEMYRILKPTGSFILNIKENSPGGLKSFYVYDLVLALTRKQQWLCPDELLWIKGGMPGKFDTRLRDGWEHLYHFVKTMDFKFYRKAVARLKTSREKERDLKRVTRKNKDVRTSSKTGSGFNKKWSRIANTPVVYPENVIFQYITNVRVDWHPAQFPVQLPDFFIRLCTDENDMVLDPFMGGGNTMFAARALHRKCIGIEYKQEYYDKLQREFFGDTMDRFE